MSIIDGVASYWGLEPRTIYFEAFRGMSLQWLPQMEQSLPANASRSRQAIRLLELSGGQFGIQFVERHCPLESALVHEDGHTRRSKCFALGRDVILSITVSSRLRRNIAVAVMSLVNNVSPGQYAIHQSKALHLPQMNGSGISMLEQLTRQAIHARLDKECGDIWMAS
ncbi:hypothetical protein B7494_g6405 [Chlorociboria aeruginascens]|nr:hypothetical protein B7494_g6405 [Chlorociboria aeruginascens]